MRWPFSAEQQVADLDTAMEHKARFWEDIRKDPEDARADHGVPSEAGRAGQGGGPGTDHD
eukprot:3348562-Pyramimonas_sp.AAC.1